MRTAHIPSKKEWVLPQRNFRTPAKKVDNEERTEEPRQQPPEIERYLLQIDRQTKRSFKTPEAARSMGLEIKDRCDRFLA